MACSPSTSEATCLLCAWLDSSVVSAVEFVFLASSEASLSSKPSASLKDSKKPFESPLSSTFEAAEPVSNNEDVVLVAEFEEGLTFIYTSSIY